MKRIIQINTTFIERYWHWIVILSLAVGIFLLFQKTNNLELKNTVNEKLSDSLLIELKNKETLQEVIKRQDSILELQSYNQKEARELIKKQKNEKTIMYITDDELPNAFAERFNKSKQK